MDINYSYILGGIFASLFLMCLFFPLRNSWRLRKFDLDSFLENNPAFNDLRLRLLTLLKEQTDNKHWIHRVESAIKNLAFLTDRQDVMYLSSLKVLEMAIMHVLLCQGNPIIYFDIQAILACINRE